MKVAIVYDRINKWGGAERILLLLHEMFPDATVYTSVYDPVSAPWAKDLKIKTSFLERIPFAKRHHEFFALFMPFAFEQFEFNSYDYVITLTSEGAKGIVTNSKTKHICICLTPTRYLWSGYDLYFPNKLSKILTYPLVWYLRSWDYQAAQRPDVLIAISDTVKDRIEKYYNRKSEVIYPPLLINKVSSIENSVLSKERKALSLISKDQGPKTKSYFLVVSRLSRFTPHKRLELAINAANRLKLSLKVIGEGDTQYFKDMAGSTVEIVGKVTDEELSSYYAHCMALIFPGIEDFGLVMVEAQSYGKPVIAFRGGGAEEIIIEGKTGEFFNTSTVTSLVKTLKKFNNKRYNTDICKKNAQRFSKSVFVKSLKKHII